MELRTEVLSASVTLLCAFFLQSRFCHVNGDDEKNIDHDKDNELAEIEAECRKGLYELSEGPFLIMAFVIGIVSVILLVTAIFIYTSSRRMISSQLEEAERNAHEVMDAVLVALIPQGLLNEIAPEKDSKGPKKEKKMHEEI